MSSILITVLANAIMSTNPAPLTEPLHSRLIEDLDRGSLIAPDRGDLSAMGRMARTEWTPRDIVFEDGQVIRGYIEGEEIRVPSGAVVFAVEDVTLVASSITIDGILIAMDRDLAGPSAAPTIGLIAIENLEITGDVLGGAGRSYPCNAGEAFLGLDGGQGSHIYLSAPEITVDGWVHGGRGGSGGPGARTGNGGDVIYPNNALTLGLGSMTGGDGGNGGDPHLDTNDGSDGGDGGNVLQLDFTLYSEVLGLAQYDAQLLQQGGSHGTPGQQGDAGDPDTGENGCWNPPGDCQPPIHNDGGDVGYTGKNGAAAQGGNGGVGGSGGNGCPNGPGGRGGKGGKGGDAFGGSGGPGGHGADAEWDPVNQVFLGPGARGGNGGNGAVGTGGNAGSGGPGGPGMPPGKGGKRGFVGLGYGGGQGVGGIGGNGNPIGENGLNGSSANGVNGALGSKGADGTPCGADTAPNE